MRIYKKILQKISVPALFVGSFLVSNRPHAASIDVTYKCNLKCKHCYFQKQNYTKELPIEDYLKILRKIRKQGVIQVAWVGGEPLLRKELIERGRKIFPFNWIITNGTVPLPDWQDVLFFVSIDGPEKVHNEIRGANVYSKIKENILTHPNLNIYLGAVLNKLNYQYIEQIIEEWKDTNIKGINFDFYTPLKPNDPLWLTWEKRDQIIKQLREINKKYNIFVLLTDKILELAKSKNAPRVHANCLLKKQVISLDPMGKRKLPCIMAGADCERCGCIMAYLGHALLKYHDWETIKCMSRLLIF